MTLVPFAWYDIFALFSSALLLSVVFLRFNRGRTIDFANPFVIFIVFFFGYNVLGRLHTIKYGDFSHEIFSAGHFLSLLACFTLFFVSIFCGQNRISNRLAVGPKNILKLFSFLCIAIGYLFWWMNFDRVGGIWSIFEAHTNRVDRNALLTELRGNYPFTHFLYIGQLSLLCYFLLNNVRLARAIFWSCLSILPLLAYFFIDGERTSILRHMIGSLFVISYYYNRRMATLRYKNLAVLLIVFIVLGLMGNFRGSVQRAIASNNFDPIIMQWERHGLSNIYPNEFAAVTFTVNRAIHDVTHGEELYLGRSYMGGASYIFPRRLYDVFGLVKKPTISDSFGEKIAWELGNERKMGFGMNPLAEAVYNFSVFGPVFFAIVIILIIQLWKFSVKRIEIFIVQFWLIAISPVFFLVNRVAFASAFAFVVHLGIICLLMYAGSFLVIKIFGGLRREDGS